MAISSFVRFNQRNLRPTQTRIVDIQRLLYISMAMATNQGNQLDFKRLYWWPTLSTLPTISSDNVEIKP